MATKKGTPTPQTGRRGTRDTRELQAALNPKKPILDFPDGLDEKYRAVWLETVNSKSVEYWSKSDIPLLLMYCRCAHDIQRLSDEIDAEGEVILNANRNPVVNPKIVVRGYAENRMMALCTKLRMQPSSRVKTPTEANHASRKRTAEGIAARVAESGDDDLLAGNRPTHLN